ncbi:MAG: hypothetical protein HC882_10090, partial [Acidobacteria bacterium]|nr:hypothetical protein [Acidobacteriota bacterium]
MSSNPQVVLLIEVLQRVFRWWGLPLAGVLLGLAAAVALFVKLPKTYEARTLIFVSPSLISEEFVRSTVPDDMALRLRSLNEAVLSRPYLSRILAEVFRVDAEHPDYEPSLRRLRSRVTATINQYNAETGAGSFELTYRDSDPDLTAKVVNALAALYIE